MPHDAIDFLTAQHRRLEESFQHALKSPPAERKRHFDRAADLLVSHITIEEQIFYPAVKAGRTEDILLESLEEHLSLKRVLADLVTMSPDDPLFEPKMHVLKEQAEHHHKEEEEHLFPKVRKLFDQARLDGLGQQMGEAQGRILKEAAARCQVLEQTDKAAELR